MTEDAKELSASREQGPLRVLAVDDSKSSRMHLNEVLKGLGHEPEMASGSSEALKLLDRKRYDVVLCDLVMPRIDGIALLKLVRSRGLTLPFLIITAHASLSSAMAALRQGADDYLTRPLSPELLDHRLKLAHRRTLLQRELILKEQMRAALATAGAAAHELNQPLMALMASAELIGEIDDPDKIRELAVKVVEQTERLGAITRRLSKLVRFVTRPYVGNSEIVDLEASSRQADEPMSSR